MQDKQPSIPPGDLRAVAGLPVIADNDALVPRFGAGVIATEPEVHLTGELNAVLLDPAAAGDDTRTLYSVCRDVAPEESVEAIRRARLVYVVLMLRPGRIGEEWTRTRGHINPLAPGTALPYPEVHEVWQGHALLYLQTAASDAPEDVVTVEMLPGQKAIVPPGWASLLVNIGEIPLVCATWRARGSEPGYAALEALRGMAHYVLAGPEPGKWTFEPNTRYRTAPVPRRVPCPEMPEAGLRPGEPMLTTFRSNPEFFHYMKRPQDSDRLWAGLYS